MRDAIRLMRLAVGFNILVAVMNLGFFINHITNSNYQSASISGVLMLMNTVVSVFLYRQLKEQQRRDKQRVVDILRGKYDEFDPWVHEQ